MHVAGPVTQHSYAEPEGSPSYSKLCLMVHHVVHLAMRTAMMILVYVLAVFGFVALLTFIIV